jgi:hypothetical protein
MKFNSNLKSGLLTPAQQKGMTAYNAAGNQQKSMYASGQIPQSMKDAAAYGGGWNSAYDSALKTTRDAWANWQPASSASDYLSRLPASRLTKAPSTGGGSDKGGDEGGGTNYTGQSTIKPPNYIEDATTEAAAGNVLAQGYANADERYQTKQLDRAGVSRGKGQQFIAGQQGVQEMSKAAQQAADIRSQDQQANEKIRTDYESMREKEALQNAMVQHSIAQSDWGRKFAEQSANAQLQMSYLQSLLQLRLSLLR